MKEFAEKTTIYKEALLKEEALADLNTWNRRPSLKSP